ncbi:hypothetical protein PSTG_03578 [Puccinia striiformis f. sp. tritici PST-78]|uniref:Uncharacterized protein n=1 Tax=Puccinia striiformis f. sp. tritici PST-78 TaxID=1165861 RepID=A0A0L0VWC0_9BASI|nr:hypothetical protein PSTG_03578 [Puccinia striiformis f. sp. tritici PST-78]
MRPVYSKSYSVQTVNKYEIRIRHLEDTRSALSLDCLMDSKSRSISFLSDATNRQAPPPDTHSLPRGEPPFSLDNRPPPLTSSPSSHSINTATPNPIQAASPAINSLADLESVHTWPTSNLTTPDPDADPNSNVFKPLSSYIDPPATTPADSGRAVDAIEQHKSHRATHSPPTVPDSTRPSLTSEITSAHASASSTPIINALSEAHCHPGDPILPDPPLLNNQYSQQPGNSSNDNLTTSSSDAVTADCSFNKEDLVQASANIITTYPHEFDVAEMGAITIRDYCDTSTDFLGSITFVEHRGTFVAPNLAPDLPHSALQHNADIDNYLNLADTDETEMKKKKNKKKKKKKAKPTSTSDNLVSDPTSNPDNPVLFYLGSDLSFYATDARTKSDLSFYATDASNATLALEFARALPLSSAHTSLSIYVSVRVIPDPYSSLQHGSGARRSMAAAFSMAWRHQPAEHGMAAASTGGAGWRQR